MTTFSGQASRATYTPITPDPNDTKALLVPFGVQLHITPQGEEFPWQWLLIRTKPPGLARKAHYMWPANAEVGMFMRMFLAC